MAAIRMDGTIDFEGQVVTTDIDIYGSPEQWTLGEMYFIIAENPQQRGMMTMYNFRRVYINEPTRHPRESWMNERQYRHMDARVAGLKPVYRGVSIDAERAMIEFYQNARACDEMFRKTLINWGMTMEPLLRRDVLIKSTGVLGYVFNVPSSQHGWYLVMDAQGEMHQARHADLIVQNPTQYLEGPLTCLECHNLGGAGQCWVTTPDVYDKGDIAEEWKINGHQSFNRPMCLICTDWFQEYGALSYGDRIWENKTGPYIYDQNQPTTCFIEPGVLPLHNVLQEQRRSLTEQRRRHPLRRRRV